MYFSARGKKRSYWPKDQEEKLKRMFANEIARRQTPASEKCKSLLHEFPHVGNDADAYRKIIWKVHTYITKSKGRAKPQRRTANEDDGNNDSDST